MKLKSIIFTGDMGSGKTFLAETIASIFPEDKVYRIDAACKTLKSIAREVYKSKYSLLIIDECIDQCRIVQINELLTELFFEENCDEILTVIYLTQYDRLINMPTYRIIQCQFSN